MGGGGGARWGGCGQREMRSGEWGQARWCWARGDGRGQCPIERRMKRGVKAEACISLTVLWRDEPPGFTRRLTVVHCSLQARLV